MACFRYQLHKSNIVLFTISIALGISAWRRAIVLSRITDISSTFKRFIHVKCLTIGSTFCGTERSSINLDLVSVKNDGRIVWVSAAELTIMISASFAALA